MDFHLHLADLAYIAAIVVAINSFVFWAATNWLRNITHEVAQETHEEGNEAIIVRLDALATTQETQSMLMARVYKLEGQIGNGLTNDIHDLREDLKELRVYLLEKLT